MHYLPPLVLTITLLLGLLTPTLAAKSACFGETNSFLQGNQHADCDYSVPPPLNSTDEEHANDLYWIGLVHQYAITNMPTLPFGAALVDSRTNTLVTIGTNMFNSPDPLFSQMSVSHAETVVITNATMLFFPGYFNETSGRRRVDANWKYLTLYGNIETCPMCAQASVWRGIRQMVFGARASVLQQKRCWTQPTLTVHEVVDHNSAFAPFKFVRGPMPELEDTIVQGFSQQCKNVTSTAAT